MAPRKILILAVSVSALAGSSAILAEEQSVADERTVADGDARGRPRCRQRC
jgi:hypothetical protein